MRSNIEIAWIGLSLPGFGHHDLIAAPKVGNDSQNVYVRQSYASLDEAFDAVERDVLPDLVVIHSGTQGVAELEVEHFARKSSLRFRAVLIGSQYAVRQLEQALRHNIFGHLPIEFGCDELMRAIHAASVSSVWYSKELFEHHKKSPEQPVLDLLSSRERQVVTLISEGATNAHAAAVLGISEHTVKAHVRRSMQKLRAKNRTQLAVIGTSGVAC
jgi:DNA-binding NarL/FixJ family response regulator